MGNGCGKKKIAPIPVVVTTRVTTQNAQGEIPYGFIRLYAGAKTSENNYSSPVISLHTYIRAQNIVTRRKGTLDVVAQENNRAYGTVSYSGPSSSVKTDKQEIEEKVRCIPVEDIISVSYSTDVKKESETLEARQEKRARKEKLGCCTRTKNCLHKTFCQLPKCSCGCCDSQPIEEPQYETNTRRNVTANRMIVIEMKCIRYANIHIPSHIQVLTADEKTKFYRDNFAVDTTEFYLVNNTEADGNHFEAKRYEAEEFCRTVVQLRNMANHYPSQAELDKILKQQQAALFGDEIRE